MDYTTLISGEELPQDPQAIDARSLYAALEQVTDGRKKRGKRYSLPLLLTLLLLARLTGETDISAAAEWIRLRKDWICERLGLARKSMPCTGTYLYALSKVNHEQLTQVIADCLIKAEAVKRCEEEPSRLSKQDGREQRQHVALDGKTLRGTLGHEAAEQPSVHILSLYEVKTGLVLTQRVMAEKENEISAAKEMALPLWVKGRVITADAIHTQKTFCQQINQYNGKYLLYFKDNHPTAHEDLAFFFEDPDADQSTWGVCSQTEKGHGRLTTRTVRTSTEMNEWFAQEWTGIAQTFQVTRSVSRPQAPKQTKVTKQAKQPKQAKAMKQAKATKQAKQPEQAKATKQGKAEAQGKETSQPVVYGFTNLTPEQAGPEAIATFLRNHWAIENRLHWRRDVTLNEDHSQVRAKDKPQVLAVLNNTTLALMDWLGVRNVPSQMRFYDAHPHLALALLLGKL